MDLETIRAVGLAAAARAGQILLSRWDKGHTVAKKGAINLVTEADIAAEQAIVATIRHAFPEHGVLAEESGITPGTGLHEWIIDPLDGTTNFAHNLPEFSISIAFAEDGNSVFGLVLNPITREIFCGLRGQGATLNGRSIHVSDTASLRDSLLVTGFPYELEPLLGAVMKRFEGCLLASQGVRRLGSAALDLCYVACGRFDGFWEQGLAPWDTAAGLVIVQEAGGTVSDFDGNAFSIEGKAILATNGHVHKQLMEALTI